MFNLINLMSSVRLPRMQYLTQSVLLKGLDDDMYVVIHNYVHVKPIPLVVEMQDAISHDVTMRWT